MGKRPPRQGEGLLGATVYWTLRFRLFTQRIPLWPFVWGVSVLWHLFLMAHAAPNVFPDSGSYTLLAEAIRDGQWHSGFTFRTPGYPAFLYAIFTVSGWKNFDTVVLVQVLLGTTVPLLLYVLFAQITERKWIAATAALSYLLDRFSLGLETVPLTEFLSGYTVLAALVAFVVGLRSSRVWASLGAGAVAAINFLIRPTFQYLYPWWTFVALVLCWRSPDWHGRRRLLLQWLVIYLAVLALTVGWWSFMVWRHTGVFAPSLQLGASMTNHTGSFMELAPDDYALIRDMYVQERDKRGGDHINLFDQEGWRIAQATSCTLWQLSLKFREINSYLIWHYPERYLSQVAKAWDRIWTEDSRYITDLTDPYATGRPAEVTPLFRFIVHNPLTRSVYGPIEEYVWDNLTLLRVMPWILLIGGAGLFIAVYRGVWSRLVIACMVSTIFYHMVVHVLVQFTEFGRYKLPVQGLWFSLFVFFLCALGDLVVTHLRWKKSGSELAK